MKKIAVASLLTIVPFLGQQAKFEIADVHVSAHRTTPWPYRSGAVLRGGRYDLRNVTMVDLVAIAYGVGNDNVLGGPMWLETDHFDVTAKAPPSTTPAELNLMLQSLLADRFKLVVHTEMKPLPAYSLMTGKGRPKLKQADGSGNTGCESQPQNSPPGTAPSATFACRNMTMEGFARTLPRLAGAYINSPVVDSTGLKGAWDFDIKWTARALLSQAGGDGITLFDAIDKELGLKLELQNIPTPVIVIDSVERRPSANPPGVTQNLPSPPPAEFEVADIKPSLPGGKQAFRNLPGGQIDILGGTLETLIQVAWNINDDEMIVSAPKWLNSIRFDIVAKVSTDGTATASPVDFDDLRLMLRTLLVERFKLATHREDQPVSAYTLVAGRPKLNKADPSNRSGCKNGPAPGTRDPREVNPVLSRLVTCKNITMAQLAEQLQLFASDYIRHPVVDATGIGGNWDFTLNFSPPSVFQGVGPRVGDPGQSGTGATTASDPSGALSIFDAVSKQLGLRLEMHKRVMSVLVIDHVEDKPTETRHGVE